MPSKSKMSTPVPTPSLKGLKSFFAVGVISILIPGLLYSGEWINPVTLIALVFGLFFLGLALINRLGVKRTLANSIPAQGEVLSCERERITDEEGNLLADFYQVLCSVPTPQGENRVFTLRSEKAKPEGTQIQLLINHQTGEAVEKAEIDECGSSSNRGKLAGLTLVFWGIAFISELVGRLVFSSGEVQVLNNQVICFLIGIPFTVIGFFLLRSYLRHRRARETATPLEGTIVAYRRRSSQDDDGHTHYTYFPIISYWQDGEQEYESDTNYNRRKHPIGSHVTLYLASDGQVFDDASMKSSLLFGVIFFLTGLLLLIVSIFVF